MKRNGLRTIIPLLFLLLAGITFVAHTGLGTLSAVGWQDISVLCPIGALGTMLASKSLVPRALISLALFAVGVLLVGRAVCGWICPVPVISRLRGITKSQHGTGVPAQPDAGRNRTSSTAPLSSEEKRLLRCACRPGGEPANSRHLVLGGALLSAAIFGFPVFCLICPIGLAFAFVFVVILLFGGGDVTWSVLLIPALLLVEVVFFRKWCSHICPISSLMSLLSKGNKTFLPAIDDTKCIETSKDRACGRCAEVCEVGIDPRHPDLGSGWNECTKCRACLENCPGNAISMPFLAKCRSGSENRTASAQHPDAAG